MSRLGDNLGIPASLAVGWALYNGGRDATSVRATSVPSAQGPMVPRVCFSVKFSTSQAASRSTIGRVLQPVSPMSPRLELFAGVALPTTPLG